MATLEKIRSKSVLLLIIIGVALLAFIIGDFLNSSRSIFGNDQSVAKVDGDKIEAAEYQKRLETANRNGAGNTVEERAYVNQQVLRQMLIEKFQKEEYEKLGLTVTDDELSDAMFGAGSMFGNMLAQQYTGGQFQTAAQFRDFCDNPAKFGGDPASSQQLREMWLNFEEMLAKQLLDYKFMNMLDGTMAANKLDVAQMYNDDNTGYMISYVKKPYATDPSIKVSDEELQKLWEADKANYSLDEESRLVSMILVPIAPSVDDEEAAKALVNKVAVDLNTTADLDALRGQKGFNHNRVTLTLSAISDAVSRGGNSKLKQFADSAKIGSAAIIQDGPHDFQIAKLFGRSVESDSVTINFAAVPVSDAAKLDSVKAAVAAGKTAEELMAMGEVIAVDSIATSLTNPGIAAQQLGQFAQILSSDLTSFKSAFLNNEIGKAFQPDTVNAMGVARFYTVTRRKAPEANVDMEMITYSLEPSSATINDLRSKLEQYVAKNNTAEKFVANAAGANYSSEYTDVSASTPYVMMGQGPQGPMFLPNSHKAAVWALEAEKGAVSGVFGDERTGAFLVAAVNDVFTDYRTIADPRVKNDLTQKARNSKAGDSMVAQLKGKANDLAGYATAMGGEVANDAVNFFTGVRNYGPELLGRIVTTGKGVLVGPSKGVDGVVVYQVNEINGPVRKIDMNTDATAFSRRRGSGVFANSDAMFRMLLGDRAYENRLYKVFGEN